MGKTVVTWMWGGPRGYRPEHVNILASMFKRHLSAHRFVCITDSLSGFSDEVEVLPMPDAAKRLGAHRTLEGAGFPSCFQRLWMFSEEAKHLGDRILLTDVDAVVTANVDHLFTAQAKFVGWRPKMGWGTRQRLSGALYLMTPGANTEVYDDFHGAASMREARSAGYRGSDQAWISYKMRDKAALWADAGIYSVRDFGGDMPNDACMVQFNGPTKPWDDNREWVKEHYR